MDYSASRLEERTLASPSEVVPYLADAHPSVTWVDVQGLGETKILEELRDIFHIHPLALADVVNVPQRSKVENFERYLFVITRMTLESGQAEFHSEQVSLFIGKTFVLTFQETYGDCLDPVRARIRSGAGLLRKSGPDYLAYAIIDALVDHYFPAVESLGERLEELEDEVVRTPTPDTLRRIYSVKRELIEIRRGIWPQREAINALLHDESGLVGREVHVYLRDCYDHAVQLIEVVESLRELATGLLDVYMSSVAQRTNEIMRVLTVVTTIFIPLTFLVGVYGMNFKTEVSNWNMPELSWRFGYPAILGTMFLIALGLLLLFARMGWLRSGAASLKAADARRGLEVRGTGPAPPVRGSGPDLGTGSPPAA
jgi:magnesium transporter